jgi:hypothetical protein
VDPLAKTPTDARDYAALNLAFLAALGALAAGEREERPGEGIALAELAVLGLATFAISKALVREKVTTWAREPFVAEDAHGQRRPRGSGMRFAVGELLTCTRCVGSWSSLAVVGLRLKAPAAGRVATTVLAASAVSDLAHAGFALLSARANSAG